MSRPCSAPRGCGRRSGRGASGRPAGTRLKITVDAARRRSTVRWPTRSASGRTRSNEPRIGRAARASDTGVSRSDPARRYAPSEASQHLDKFKDECGVFGIFGHPEAANLTYLGLYALQHRGQESAGHRHRRRRARLQISRAMGHVADGFNEQALASPAGHIAIGHTRYSTAGESRLQERAADSDRLRARPDRHRPQRQSRQRAASCATVLVARRIDLPDQQRHRGRAASLRPIAGAGDRGCADRIDLPGDRARSRSRS